MTKLKVQICIKDIFYIKNLSDKNCDKQFKRFNSKKVHYAKLQKGLSLNGDST